MASKSDPWSVVTLAVVVTLGAAVSPMLRGMSTVALIAGLVGLFGVLWSVALLSQRAHRRRFPDCQIKGPHRHAD